MFKKRLVTLVCLTVLSAVWAFATSQYSVSTKINSLGTQLVDGKYVAIEGGTIKTRIAGAPATDPDKVVHTLGTVYTNALHTESVDVTVTPKAGYKITAVTKAKYSVVGAVAVLGAYESQTIANDQLYTTTFSDPDAVLFPKLVGKTQFLVATFAPIGGGSALNWQLQVQNNNTGGSVTVNRGTAGQSTYLNKVVDNVGKPYVKNFIDAGETTITVNAASGYTIDYIVENGVKTFYGMGTREIKFTPTAAARIKTFLVGYKRTSIPVTTANAANNGGIAPLNPVADPYGVVRLIITPTGLDAQGRALNTVTNVSATGGTVALTDRFGAAVAYPLAAPFVGPLKATISNIKYPVTAVTVTATYGFNAVKDPATSNCTNTCHVDAALVETKPYVKAAATEWAASAHSAKNVDCVTCHATMPGNIGTGSVDPSTFKVTDAKAGAVGSNYCSRCHAASVNKVLASAHYTKPSGALVCTDCHAAGHNLAGNREACANCHTYVNEHTAENTAGKGCVECHDKHNPATITGTLGTPSAHPAVTLYTFEEIGMQMAGGAKVPVQVDANGKGMPYSPKQTCGTSGCHVKGGVDYTYDKISDHAFHSNEGRSEYQDSATGKFDATKNKPWVQSAAMVGKW